MSFEVKVNPAFKSSLHAKEISVVRWAARTCIGEIRNLMEHSPATGRVYHGHRASAPGEPPAVDTGALIGSIEMDVKETPTGGESVVGSRLAKPIWRFLEFGTAHMLPRPSARPAFLTTMIRLKEVLHGGAGVTGIFGRDVK